MKPRIMQIFPHRDVDMWGRVWMSRFRGAWQNLNFDKEYLFGFETLVFATSGILSILEIASYNPFIKITIKSDKISILHCS